MSRQRLKLHVWVELSNGGSESHALVWEHSWQEWPWAPHYKSQRVWWIGHQYWAERMILQSKLYVPQWDNLIEKLPKLWRFTDASDLCFASPSSTEQLWALQSFTLLLSALSSYTVLLERCLSGSSAQSVADKTCVHLHEPGLVSAMATWVV